MLDNFGVDI